MNAENYGPGLPQERRLRPGWIDYTPPLLLALLVALAGCAGPPTKVERRLFTIETNFVTVVQTNVVTATNFTAGIVGQDNATATPILEAQQPAVTNYTTNIMEVYRYMPRPEALQTVTQLGNFIPGYGELAALVLAGGLALWGKLRSNAAGRAETAGIALAQVIETGRAILKVTPQGQALEAAWLAWMQKHQIATGTANQILDFLREINTPEATAIAASITGQIK